MHIENAQFAVRSAPANGRRKNRNEKSHNREGEKKNTALVTRTDSSYPTRRVGARSGFGTAVLLHVALLHVALLHVACLTVAGVPEIAVSITVFARIIVITRPRFKVLLVNAKCFKLEDGREMLRVRTRQQPPVR